MDVAGDSDPTAILEKLKELINTEKALKKLLGVDDTGALTDCVEHLKKSIGDTAQHVATCEPGNKDLCDSVGDICKEPNESRKLIAFVVNDLAISPVPEFIEDKEEVIADKIKELQKMKASLVALRTL